MDGFFSTFTNRLDSKGRISIPAPFRVVLARDGCEALHALPCLDAQALDCGGGALLREIDGLVTSFPPYSPERDALSLALLGSSEALKMDSEGRVVLTDSLKSWAGIAMEATLVGQGHKFQIWEPQRFRARLEEARLRARDLRSGAGRLAGAGA